MAEDEAADLWVVYSHEDQIRLHDADGSLLVQTTAGMCARMTGCSVEELHHKLRTLCDNGRLYKWDVGTFTFVNTHSRYDTWNFLRAKLDHKRYVVNRRNRNTPELNEDHEPVDFDTADIDYWEN